MRSQDDYYRDKAREGALESQFEKKTLCAFHGRFCNNCDGKDEYGNVCFLKGGENKQCKH